MRTTKIEYIGKKPIKKDTVAGTGTVWNGPGDVQDVPDKAVAALIAHTGVWALADGARAPAATGTAEATGDKNAMSEADAMAPMANLDSMDAPALRDYAQRHFGHEFHHKTGEDKMRTVIIGLMNRG